MDDMEERMKKMMNEMRKEKEAGSTEFDDLPKDIIFNIFSRIPIQPLFTFRSVSKQWCKLIDHPHLSLIHIKQDHPFPFSFLCDYSPLKNTTFLHTVQLLRRDYSPLKNTTCLRTVHLYNKRRLHASQLPLVELDFSYPLSFGSCNGLLFFVSTPSSIILSNPLRRQSLQLPPIPISTFSSCDTAYGLGFDTCINIFKMVCVIFNECTMILNVGGPTSFWRKIPQLPPCPICYIPVFSRGFLYWKVDPYYALYDKINSLIVSFDVKNEVFSFVPHPHSSRRIQLLDLNGNIAIVDFGNFGYFTVSVMKDYQQKKWSIQYSVPISFPKQVVTSFGKDGEILIRIKGCFYIYNPTEDYLEYADEFKSPQQDPRPIVHSFTGSLFSLRNVTEEDYLES